MDDEKDQKPTKEMLNSPKDVRDGWQEKYNVLFFTAKWRSSVAISLQIEIQWRQKTGEDKTRSPTPWSTLWTTQMGISNSAYLSLNTHFKQHCSIST